MGVPFNWAPPLLFSPVEGEKMKDKNYGLASIGWHAANLTFALLARAPKLQETLWKLNSV